MTGQNSLQLSSSTGTPFVRLVRRIEWLYSLPESRGLNSTASGDTMKQDETHITKAHDFAEIVKAPELGLVSDFLEQPLPVIVESLTGFLASGPKEGTLSVGRLVQAPFKAKLFQQVAEEIETFRAKGRIRNDFADQDKGPKAGWIFSRSLMRNRRMRKDLTL